MGPTWFRRGLQSSQALAFVGNYGGKKIAKDIGLDQFSIGASESGLSDEQVVNLGKSISEKLSLGYEQSLTGAASIAKATWQRESTPQARPSSTMAGSAISTCAPRRRCMTPSIAAWFPRGFTPARPRPSHTQIQITPTHIHAHAPTLRDAFFVVRALNSISELGTMEDYLRWLTNVVVRSAGGHVQRSGERDAGTYDAGKHDHDDTQGTAAWRCWR